MCCCLLKYLSTCSTSSLFADSADYLVDDESAADDDADIDSVIDKLVKDYCTTDETEPADDDTPAYMCDWERDAAAVDRTGERRPGVRCTLQVSTRRRARIAS